MNELPSDLVHELSNILDDRVKVDLASRLLYSTDASLYKIKPLGVVFPRHTDELQVIMELASRFGVPVIARGAGSGLAGQAIGPGLIVDCSRYLDRVLTINPEEQKVKVEPGVIVNSLNHVAAQYNLQFGPDPSSAERATIGGSVSNNATGSHSILYGMSADHVLSAEVTLSDGSPAHLSEIPMEHAVRISQDEGLISDIYRSALNIREHLPAIIRKKWPRTYRTVSGYNLNYLIPWAASCPPRWHEYLQDLPYPPTKPGHINLAQLIAGSEGTLALIRTIELRLVQIPKHKILTVLSFRDSAEACNQVPTILDLKPTAIELIPQMLVELARSIPGYARNLPSVFDDLQSMLVVEFAGDSPSELKEMVRRMGKSALVAESPIEQGQIWGVRKVGLGILMSRPGDYKPVPGIEDMSVPVEHLGDFVRGVERIFAEHNTRGDFYGHASAGCLHIRPILNIKTSEGMAEFRTIAHACLELVQKFGGSISAEHGDGMARGEWIEKLFGSEIVEGFRELKNAADPHGLLNPGKKLNVPAMDQNVRYNDPYHARAWMPVMDFTRQGSSPGEMGLIAAVEQCNGAGVCRKFEGVMCPSFQATRDEMHSTRGRANLLREMMYGNFPSEELAIEAVFEALDLCLACKGCRVECPSGVDMAKIKYEFLEYYYNAAPHRRRLSDYLFGYIDVFARYAHPVAPLVNFILKKGLIRSFGESIFGLTRFRHFPELSKIPYDVSEQSNPSECRNGKVLIQLDAFNRFFYPDNVRATLRILRKLGYEPHVIPVIGTGRTLISKGFLNSARRHAGKLVECIYELDPSSEYPIIGIEPSEINTFKDELSELLPTDPRAQEIKSRSYLIDEFLIRPGSDGLIRMQRLIESHLIAEQNREKVFVHGHCYQKAQTVSGDGFPVGVDATLQMLNYAGYEAHLIDAGCCGMAGGFGYEADHYQLSMEIGALMLFPAIKRAIEAYGEGIHIAASGISCMDQIRDGTGVSVVHPIQLIDRIPSTQ